MYFRYYPINMVYMAIVESDLWSYDKQSLILHFGNDPLLMRNRKIALPSWTWSLWLILQVSPSFDLINMTVIYFYRISFIDFYWQYFKTHIWYWCVSGKKCRQTLVHWSTKGDSKEFKEIDYDYIYFFKQLIMIPKLLLPKLLLLKCKACIQILFYFQNMLWCVCMQP